MDIIQRLLQTPEVLMGMTREYVSVVFAGIIFVFLYNFFSYLLRAMGNSIVPLIFLAVSSVVNIVLDIWFIVGFDMGVAGAALATVIAQALSGIGIMIYSFIKLPVLHFGKDRIKWNRRRMKEIIVNDVATVKIDTIAYMPAQEFGNAYSLFVSQNYGAKRHDRIKKGTNISFISSVVFCAVISVLIFVFAENLMQLFVGPFETKIIYEGVRYLRIEGAMYVGIGVLFLWYGYFRGINKPHISLILTVISLGTRVVLSYTFAPATVLGVTVIWISIPIGWILADLSGYIYYRRVRK